MRKVLFTVFVVALAWCAGTTIASAQATTNQTLTINATVSARVTLTLSVAAVTFGDADPDVTNPIVLTDVLTITAKARVGAAQGVTLTAAAAGPLTSGSDTIPIGNVSWTCSGAGYVPGTMNTVAQAAGSWTGPGSYAGVHSFSLVNNWSYAPGNYSTTVLYTLSAA